MATASWNSLPKERADEYKRLAKEAAAVPLAQLPDADKEAMEHRLLRKIMDQV